MDISAIWIFQYFQVSFGIPAGFLGGIWDSFHELMPMTLYIKFGVSCSRAPFHGFPGMFWGFQGESFGISVILWWKHGKHVVIISCVNLNGLIVHAVDFLMLGSARNSS